MNHRRRSVFREINSRPYSNKLSKLPSLIIDDESFIQRLGLLKRLPVHAGCVNTICWNDSGQYILSGSDDQNLVITNGHNYKVEARYSTSHNANIFSAKFLPCSNDKQIVSCSGDGIILHTDLTRPNATFHNQFNCHAGTTTYEVITIPQDPNTFLSCGEDGTVRWFDLREKTSCSKQRCKDDILVSCQRAVTALAINPNALQQLAIGCADSTVRIYDRRYLSTQPGDHLLAKPFCTFMAPHFDDDRHYRITSLNYSLDGKDMLVSYSSEYLYLFNIQENQAVELKKTVKKLSPWDKLKAATVRHERLSPPPVRRLRLRGDWSDTGPDARPERDTSTTVSIGQARPQLQPTMMQRMTDVLSRMLNDPMTRAALSAGGEDSVDPDETRSNSESVDATENMETDQQRSELPPTTGAPTSVENSQATESNRSSSSSSGISSNLHSHLTALRNLREGFIVHHGSEPSVSFRFSHQSTSNSTISLRVGDEINSFENTGEYPTTVPSTSENQNDSSGSEMNTDSGDAQDNFKDMEINKLAEVVQNCYEAEMKMKYVGHRNARTMIKEATFWGNDYVMSGSDCGHVFIWNRHTSDLKMLLQADQHVVNCLQPHPTMPLLATSGIDHDIKLWAPILPHPSYNEELAKDLINRNAIMLEETKDTITVPATFMIRMLSCLNQIRRDGRLRHRRRTEDT